MRWLSLWVVVMMCSVSISYAEDRHPISVSDAWIREGPPVVSTLAGYARVENLTDREIALVGATSPDFTAVEFHRTEVVDGLARMREEQVIVIAAGASVSLEPGGLHMMLMNPQRALKAGDRAIVELRLSDGRLVRVELPIHRQAPER